MKFFVSQVLLSWLVAQSEYDCKRHFVSGEEKFREIDVSCVEEEMKALVKHSVGLEGIGVVDIPVPEIGPEDVLIEVKAAAICGTDIHIMNDDYPVDMPLTIGHEFSGVISQVGSNVRGWSVGDRVIAEGSASNCGACGLCRNGKANLCLDNKYLGIRLDGAFAEYVKIPSKLLHRIPSNVDFEEAALAEPAAIAIEALLEKNSVQVGDFVVVLGCGPIGLLAGQIAKAAGASRVMITGRNSAEKARFQVAAELGGYDDIFNVQARDPISYIQQETKGMGVDLIFDTTGRAHALKQAFRMVRRAGTILIAGIGDSTLEIPWDQAIKNVLKVQFCRGAGYGSFEKFCSLVETGKLNLYPMVSSQYNLEDWHQAFDSVQKREAVKALLLP